MSLSYTQRRVGAWLAALLAAAAILRLAWIYGRAPRAVPLALSAEEASALCAREGYPLDDFWERAQAIGVSAALVREERLSDLAARGEILAFTRAEVEKGRAMGVIAPGAPLKPNAVWTKDIALLARLRESAAAGRVVVATSAYAGYHVAEFPVDYDWGRLDMAVSPAVSSALAKHGLAPAAWSRGKAAILDHVYETRELEAGAGAGKLLRAAFGTSNRMLVLSLDGRLGVEENLDLLRLAARSVKDAGVELSLSRSEPPPLPWPALAWLAGILGPLFAARAGLRALRRARNFAMDRLPLASPVPELAAGLFGSAAAASAIGLVSRAFGGSSLQAPAGRSWIAPLALVFLFLYGADWARWRKGLAAPPKRGELLRWALAGAALLALVKPGLLLRAAGLAGWERAWAGSSSAFWWWPWRWREALIGFPCLVYAQRRVLEKWDCPDCQGEDKPVIDPRPWILAGLVGPIGVIVNTGNAGLPLGAALEQTACVALIGALLGGAVLAAQDLLGWKR